jgi:2-keto-4-pentenoate hydratase/2-oxohepta-3-ene-1,7-dioic acid hydratase in catechol pathway
MKILCVGRNYAKHVKEMGQVTPPLPMWFWKPESAMIHDGEAIVAPPGIGPIHHEVELAVRVGRRLKAATPGEALRAVDAITVANDVTARALQDGAKKAGTPWAQAKGYDTFLPLGAWQAVAGRNLADLQLRLTVDGVLRQQENTRAMTWGVADLLAHASTWTTLIPGDILLTGTPDGVGPMEPGQTVEAEVVGVARIRNPVVAG